MAVAPNDLGASDVSPPVVAATGIVATTFSPNIIAPVSRPSSAVDTGLPAGDGSHGQHRRAGSLEGRLNPRHRQQGPSSVLLHLVHRGLVEVNERQQSVVATFRSASDALVFARH